MPENINSSMNAAWDLWEKLLNMGDGSSIDARKVAIDQAIEAFLDGMKDDPAFQSDAIVEGELTPIIAARKSALECSIKAAPNTNLHIGDLVECLNEKWLVIELYADKIGIINGVMWICNEEVNFQNRTSNIITRYCVIDDGSYSRKTSDPVAYVPVNTYKLYLSIDSETTKLYIDKRLSFGKIYSPDGYQILEVYKIIGMDLKSKNFGEGSHLMVLTLQRGVYNADTDDIEKNICNTHIESNIKSEVKPEGTCSISGRDTIRIGTTRKYKAVFKKNAGNTEVINVGIAPIWSIKAPLDITTVCDEDGTLTISVPLQAALIGREIDIVLTDNNATYGSAEMKVRVITVG